MINFFSSKEANKFTRLNFNLKNEIFDYLPFTTNLITTPFIHRKFSIALNKKKPINYLKKNLKILLKKFNDCEIKNFENLENYLKSELPTLEEYEAIGLISFLILKSKTYEYETFSFLKEELSHKYFEFLKFSKRIKILKFFKDDNLNKDEYAQDYTEKNNDQIEIDNQKSKIINFINENFFRQIKSILNTNANIDTLFFYGFFSNDPCAEMLGLKEILTNNTSIKKLIFEHCGFYNDLESLNILKDILAANKSIRSLCFSRHHLDKFPKAMEILAEIMKKNKSIKNLKLNHNLIGRSYKAMNAMMQILNSNKTLKYLDFTENDIESTRNKKSYKQMLSEAKGLKSLKFKIEDNGLRFNGYPDNLKILSEILDKNKNIKKLKIEKIEMYKSPKILKNIEDIINKKQIKSVYVKFRNVYYSEYWKTLRDFILSNPKIKGIKIEKCRINDSKGLAYLRQAIVNNKNIKKLVVKKFNYFSHVRKIFKIFEDILFQNENLKTFKINVYDVTICTDLKFYYDQINKLNVNNKLIQKYKK